MSVSLRKGDKVDLTKKGEGGLNGVMVGLGWDQVEKSGKKGFFASLFSSAKPDIDCDASAFLCGADGKIVNDDDIVYFGNLRHKTNCVIHMGDNLTGAGEGDDEQIFVDLKNLPKDYGRIVFTVNIYKADERAQHFGLIKNAFIRLVNADTNKELCRYDLSENYDNMTAMIFAEMIYENGGWRFEAVGQATKDLKIGALASRYK